LSSANTFYIFHQQQNKESKWEMSLASDRDKVLSRKPAFSTVLELNTVPEDRDWSKVRYRGPFYADFDAGDDLPLVCDRFKDFLVKLDADLDFDLTQARLYASGSKGFHVEIPAECFMAKVPPTGTPWLAYVYRTMAESLIVDTLDLNVYTGKRGRQWRTTNVVRENGCYKVPLTLEEALSMDADLYRELIKAPRVEPIPSPPLTNPKFVMLFERGREKVTSQMRNKKKRVDKANVVLDPWRAAKKTPPTVEMLMDGREISDRAGFQSIAMQLSVYATSVSMPLAEFLDRCKGLVERHVSDGTRYNSPDRRREELSRMWEYMSENSLYDFEVDPLVRLLKQGTDTSDLGVLATEDREDRETKPPEVVGPAETDTADGDAGEAPAVVDLNIHRKLRRGFFMNAEGMFKKSGEDVEPVCRATLRNVDAFYDVEKSTFMGYEFDIVIAGKKRSRQMASSEIFTSAQQLRKFFAAYQISFQGSDSDAAALMDIMAEKAERGGKVYTYPREGFFIINHPEADKPTPVKVFLTKDTFLSSIAPDDPAYFQLKYKPTMAVSSYDIDIHWAPPLEKSMSESVYDLFNFNKPTVVADLIGWFCAAHYRSIYLRLFGQFPMLQAFGEAGSGKSQSIITMAHFHWYMSDRISIKSAMSFTPFALDSHASSSTSAPFIIDEYKPRELRSAKGKFEKLKDLFKASYIGGDIGERGTVNKGAENSLALIKSKATAPICFMGEAIEMETAIVERSVCVPFSKLFHSAKRSAAFNRLQMDPTIISSIGREIVTMGFKIGLPGFRDELRAIIADIELRQPAIDDENKRRLAPRMIFNRAVVIHGLSIFKRALHGVFGDEFDTMCHALATAKNDETDGEDNQVVQLYAISEMSKVLSRIALLSRERDSPYDIVAGQDYMLGEGFLDLKVEKAYDKYRIYCATVRDTPLFDNLDAFSHALTNYSPCTEKQVPGSPLRENGSTERVVRFSLKLLSREGVQAFKSV